MSPPATITVQRPYRRAKEFGGLNPDQANRLKELEKRNAQPKGLVGELSLVKQALNHIA